MKAKFATEPFKGPIRESATGSAVTISDAMVNGLLRSTLVDMRLNTATSRVVVDTLGMTPSELDRFASSLEEGMRDLGNAAKPVVYLE